jgi:hypothetical protein
LCRPGVYADTWLDTIRALHRRHVERDVFVKPVIGFFAVQHTDCLSIGTVKRPPFVEVTKGDDVFHPGVHPLPNFFTGNCLDKKLRRTLDVFSFQPGRWVHFI